MLQSVFKATFIFSPVRPSEGPLSFFFISHILSLISSSIGPSGSPPPMHVVVLPLPFVFAIVHPDVSALTVNLIVKKLALVNTTVRK